MKKFIGWAIAFSIGAVLFTLHKTNQEEKREAQHKEMIEDMVEESLEKNSEAVEKLKSSKPPGASIQKKNNGAIEFLSDYQRLSKKVLLSQKEQSEKFELLQNESKLRKSYLYLKDLDSGEPRATRIKNTMVAVDFIGEALRWEDNPNRNSVILKTRYFLLDEILDRPQSDDQLRASATDKAELYQILKTVDKNQADEIRQLAKGTKLMAVIDYAETNI